jgi:hypothetical protein
MSRIDRSVVAYAFLAQAQRSGKDLLSGLMPIFKPIAKLREGERFDPKEFASLAGELYGLSVSAWAVESLAPRLEAAGVLVRIQLAEGVHGYAYAQIDEDYTEVTEKDVAYVLGRFVAFSKPLLADKDLGQLGDEALKESFLQHIVDLDFVGILLKPARSDDQDGKPKLGLTKPAEQREWEDDKARRAKIDVLCASFIVDIYHRDRPLYDLVARITAGALVSEVVLNFQNPEAGVALNQLRVVLDAPFLMDALDLAGRDAYAVASSICEQLRENGARLAVFRHSIDEMKENLGAVIGAVDAGEGYGPTARRLADKSFRAYASAVRESPDARLKQEKIEIIDAPHSPRAYRWFTQDDEEAFCRSLGYYQNRKAQERDAASVAGVVRLREGNRVRMGKFHACRTLFVTSNPWVADRSKKALEKTRIYEEGDVPAALTDRYLAGLLWVLYGGTAGELPAQVLLANCAAAIEPQADLIQRMHKFLVEVDDKRAEYFRALMTEERAAQYLSKLSLGDSSYISQDNAAAVLETMKLALLEQHEKDREQERKGYERKAEQQAAEYAQQREEMEAELREARAEALKARDENKAVQATVQALEDQMRRDRLERDADELKAVEWCVGRARSAWRTAHWVAALGMAVAGAGAALLANQAGNPYVRWFGFAGGGAVMAFSFGKIPDLVFGSLLTGVRNRALHRALGSRGIDPDRLRRISIDWDTAVVKHLPDEENMRSQVAAAAGAQQAAAADAAKPRG